MQCGHLSHKASLSHIMLSSIRMKCDLVPDNVATEAGKTVPFPSSTHMHFYTPLFFLPLFLSATLSQQFNHHSSPDSAAAALHPVCRSNHLVPQLQQKEARLVLRWPLQSLSLYPFLLSILFHYLSKFSLSLSFSFSNLLQLLPLTWRIRRISRSCSELLLGCGPHRSQSPQGDLKEHQNICDKINVINGSLPSTSRLLGLRVVASVHFPKTAHN